MNINKSISSDLQIAFYKSNKNLKFQLKIIVWRIPQSIKIKSNAFIYSTDPQISFLNAEVIFLLNLSVKIIIILNLFSKKENSKIKSMLIVWKIKRDVKISLRFS